jgi:hypothetical protein
MIAACERRRMSLAQMRLGEAGREGAHAAGARRDATVEHASS